MRAPAHVKSKPIWSGGKSCERATSRKYRLKKSAREARRENCQHLRSMTHTRGTGRPERSTLQRNCSYNTFGTKVMGEYLVF